MHAQIAQQEMRPQNIASRIRDKVADLNDELILAALAEVDVEIMVDTIEGASNAGKLRVWCRQEV